MCVCVWFLSDGCVCRSILDESRGSMVFVERAGMSAFSWQAGGSLVITPDVQRCGLHLSLAPSVFTSKADFLSLSDSNKDSFMQLCSLPNTHKHIRAHTHRGGWVLGGGVTYYW